MTSAGRSDTGPLGLEWIVDARGCEPGILRDRAALESLIATVVRDLDLHPVGSPLVHQFDEQGITALVLLSESHLAIHTFPEQRSATLNLYCCRARAPFDWSRLLAASLGARQVSVRTMARGAFE